MLKQVQHDGRAVRSIPIMSLTDLVAEELSLPVDPRATAMAAAIAAKHPTARAVLFYGSCLRETQLDGLMLDFYLIVGDYAQAFPARWMATANRLLPPNVFPFEHDGLIAKYAVLSEADFARMASPSARDVSVFARFAQPSRLAWASDDAAREKAVQLVAQAAPTLLCLAWPTLGQPIQADPLAAWRAAFALTYGAELRAERGNRPGSLVDADPARYLAFTAPALAATGTSADTIAPPDVRAAAHAGWRRMQRRGKRLTLARLAKASATYAGGIDYLAWKISRHSGQKVEIRPWQRKWPLLGALTLLPRLILKGAVR
jgi:hypothetical protein